MSSVMKKSILAGGSFAGGLLAGFILSSRKDEFNKFVSSAKSLSIDWLQSVNENREHITRQGKHKVSSLQKEIRRNLTDPIPDLYKATESMTLDDLDLKLPR